MARPDRPLLILGAPRQGTFRAPSVIGGGPRNPKKGRQIERLDPKFEALQDFLASRRAALQADPGGVAPEQVLVFETNGPVREFHEVVARTRGLEWLADDELRDLAPDEDFFVADKPDKEVSAQLYLVMSNHEALEQLLSVWRIWKSGQRVPAAFRAWQEVFRQLRDVRPWSVQDRLRETRILDAWRERVALGVETVAVEIELWFRGAQGRQGALGRLRRYVERARGQWVSMCLIEPIAYHAVVAKLPIAAVERILDHEEVELLQCEDVRLFRPVGQAGAPIVEEEFETLAEEPPARAEPLGSPVVALLDGLPLENHAYLRGRLIVDDPDGWSETYPASSRGHGTSMASLILNGDLGAGEPASPRSLYVRPILRPDSFTGKHEFAPDDVSWVDLIHRAVTRAVEGDGDQPAAAPSVRVFNLSVGDPFQPFLHSLSPLAKLLDWLSWRYKILFVVSAGNHQQGITLTAADGPVTEDAVLKLLADSHRNRRLLSPAESVNAITVGATPEDAAGDWRPNAGTDTLIATTDGIPSIVSAFGRGYRRAVKPDVLGPGGRVVLTATPTPGEHEIALRPRIPPGQKVAAPGRPGDLTAFRFSFGTSNAAALTSRLASTVHDALSELRDEPNFEEIAKVPVALWIKALLVHGASWTKEAFDAALRALRNERNARSLSDELTAILGYGKVRPSRVIACSPERATMLTAGALRADETKLHALPIPASLHTHAVWRRLTITLSWFTPIRPNHRKYRAASVFFEPPSSKGNPLLVQRANADWRAVRRGTVQHEVLEADRGAIDIGADAVLEIPVTCLAEAGPLDEAIDYAMAVTLEVAPGVSTRVYDEIRERVRPRVPVRPIAP